MDDQSKASQMPIGKYIYCSSKMEIIPPQYTSQMPIGKYIYCSFGQSQRTFTLIMKSQMPIGKYIYCRKDSFRQVRAFSVTNAYRQVHLL